MQTEKTKKESEEFKKMEAEIISLRDKVYEFTKLDPRLSIQTKIYENEIQKLVFINEQSQNQLSKINYQLKNTEKEKQALSQEINELLAGDVNELLQKLNEKELQIMEMVKMTNEKHEELLDIRGKTLQIEQANVKLLQKNSLLQENLKLLKENRQFVHDTNSKFFVNQRTECGVNREDEYTAAELHTLYKIINQLKDQINMLEKSSDPDIFKNPAYHKKVLDLELKEKEIKIKLDYILILEQKSDRMNSDLKKEEAIIQEKDLELEKSNDQILSLNSQIGQLNFTVCQLNNSLNNKNELLSQVNTKLGFISAEANDIKELNRISGLILNTTKSDLLVEQERNSFNAIATKEIRHELEILRNENSDLQETIITNTEEFFEKITEIQDTLDEAELANAQMATKNTNSANDMELLRRQLESENTKLESLNYKVEYLNKTNDKYARLLKLPADFAEKLTNYDDFIQRFNEIQDENALKQQELDQLQARLDAIIRETRHPHNRESKDDYLQESGFSEQTDQAPRAVDARKFLTGVGRVVDLGRQGEADDKRTLSQARKIECLEAENKSLKQNLKNLMEKTYNLSENSSIKVKDFFTSIPINPEDLKMEMASRNRKIESLHTTIARQSEDYKQLKEKVDKLQRKLSLKSEENRLIDMDRIALLESIQKLKENGHLQQIFNEPNLSAANLSIIKLLEEKEDYFKKIVEIYSLNNQKLAQENATFSENDNTIKMLKEQLKEAKEHCEKTELKFKSALASSESAQSQTESMRPLFIQAQNELELITKSLKSETEKRAKFENEVGDFLAKQRILENQIEKLKDLLKSQREISKSLQEQIQNYKDQLENEVTDPNDKFYQKLDLKETEIHRLKNQLKEHVDCMPTIQTQKRNLADNEFELKKLASENNALNTEITNFKADNQRAKKEILELGTHSALVRDELQVLGANYEKQSANLGALEKGNRVLREHIKNLVISYQIKNTDNSMVISELFEETKLLKNILGNLRKKIRIG